MNVTKLSRGVLVTLSLAFAFFSPLSGDCRLFANGVNQSVESAATQFELFNRGVAGDSSSDLLARVDQDVVALQPDLTIVMVGTNDMLNSSKMISMAQYKENLTQIIERIQAAGSEVMLLSSLPADSEYLFKRHDKSKFASHPDVLMSQARDIAKALSQSFNCHFVDLFEEFTQRGIPQHNTDVYIRNEVNSRKEDGVHPTAEGYTLMGQIIWHYFSVNDLAARYKRVVCFGDSITKGVGASGAGTITGKNYPSYLNVKLNE